VPTFPQRYSQRAFPPYSFQPGVNSHPHENPQGHSYGKPETAVNPLNVENWAGNETYLYGVDLYNHQYWWESHEAWEGLWKASSDPLTKEFLQGLIKVSAAFIKWQAKSPRGLKIHYENALAHLKKVSAKHPVYMGVDLPGYIRRLEEVFTPVLETPADPWPSPTENYPLVSLCLSG
jgi:uncharacterized protein